MLLGFETHHMFVFGPSLSRKSKGCFEFEPHRSLLASFSYKFAVNPGNMRCIVRQVYFLSCKCICPEVCISYFQDCKQ